MRNERITVIFINNGIYGMTGGQMAPTTQIGQKTTTSPFGRDPSHSGYPIKMSEVLAQMEGDNYIARSTLHNPAGIVRAKRFIKSVPTPVRQTRLCPGGTDFRTAVNWA